MKWQSIENAPKNESILLSVGGKIVVGHCHLSWQRWKAEFSHDDYGSLPNPQYWMPIPKAPE